MLRFRRTCPFGLPDDADTIEHIVIFSVGHTLRAASDHLAEAPLPAALAELVSRLSRIEHAAQPRSRGASRPRRAPMHQPAAPSAGGGSIAVEIQVAV